MSEVMAVDYGRPKAYYGIPAAVYHQDPCPYPSASCTILQELWNKTPLHAKEKHPKLKSIRPMQEPLVFNAGTIVHELLLTDCDNIVVVTGGDYKSKARKIE